MPTPAQQPDSNQSATVKVAGEVRTAGKVPVPGASVKLVHVASGRGWVTWTDENGRFELPNLPAGKYRIEVQQLGFQDTTLEFEFAAEKAASAALTLKTISLAALAPKPEPAPQQAATQQANAQQPAAAQPPAPGQPPAQRPGAPGQSGQRPGQPGQMTPQMAEQARQRAGQGGFQQVDLLGQAGAAGGVDASASLGTNGLDANPLGEASSSDAFLMSGTVGRGATAGPGAGFPMFTMMGGSFDPSMFGGFPGGAGGFPGGAGGFPGVAGGVDMGNVMIMIGGGGPGGPGGGPGGGRPGAQGQQGQQGRQGARAQPGQQGARGQQQTAQTRGQQAQGGNVQTMQVQGGGFGGGVEALWGMQRLMRMAANRVRFSFYNRYGNSVADARPYALNAQNPAKIASYRELFGFSLGGPLKIPKIYDGRDKTLFFVNYDLGRNRNPVDTFATVPTQEERNGDFTARGLQLFDPASNLNGPRTAFGSVIPANRQDPAAVGLLQFIPLPNLPGTVQNFHLQGRVPQSTDRLNVRILQTINNRLNLQVAYGMNSSRSQSIQNLPALRGKQSVLGQNVNIGLTQQYTRRLTNDTRLMWSRNRIDSLNRFAFTNDIAGALGITGISTDPINYGVPFINYTNFTDLNDPVPALRRNQTLRVTDNVSYAMSKHTFRAGGEIRREQRNTRNDPTARGQFTFTGLMTAQLDAQGRPIAGTGNDFADFLLGLPQSTNVRFGSSRTYFRSWGFNAFVQDDWRIHPRFSLTFGLRYELATAPVELFDKLANLDIDPAITQVALVLPGQIAPFSGELPRPLIRTDVNNFSPRLGIAWRPKLPGKWPRNMTVRAGYSRFYNGSVYNQLSTQLANQPPHASAQTILTSSTQLLTLQNGFPPVTPGEVPNTVAVDPNYKVGYAQIWNTAVETQVSTNWFFDITYTGTKGTHLDLLRSPNRAMPGSPLTTEDNRRIPNAPGFTYDTSGASSIYHALQINVRRRMARGFMVMGTYTFGKSIDNASSIGGGAQVVVQDDTNFRAERGLSSFDVRHQFRSFFNYELPFGERRRFASKGWKAEVFGSWTLNGNVTAQTGTPFTARVLGSAANNSGTGNNFSERADQVGDPSLPRSQRTTQLWFNTSAFTLPAAGLFGNAARNTIPGPGLFNVNLSLGKGIRFGRDRQRRMDLRWEVQNVFNHPNYGGIGTVVNSTNYGRVLSVRGMRTMELNLRVNF